LLQEWTQRSQPLSFFDELKRRKVFRVGIAYIVGAWVFAQVAALVADVVFAQAWVMQAEERIQQRNYDGHDTFV